jgi:hypothetical protein
MRPFVDLRALGDGHLLLPAEADGLAADRIVLAERVALPVVLHDDPAEVGVALEADAHQVECLSLVPVGRGPHRDDARDALAIFEPNLDPDDRRPGTERQQVVVEGEAGRLGLGRASEPLGRGLVQVAAGVRAEVAGDSAVAPAEVVDRRDVRKEVEAFLVAQVQAGLDEARRIDDERRLAVRVLALDQARDSLESQPATPRIS